MEKPSAKTEPMTGDTLAKRVFALTMIAAIVYVAAVIVLMSTQL